MTIYRQDNETGKLYEVVREAPRHHHFVRGSFQPYLSPVDGTQIHNNGQLAEHNRRNGVTNDLDHLREQSTKKPSAKGSKHERKLAIKDAMERVSSSGYKRLE